MQTLRIIAGLLSLVALGYGINVALFQETIRDDRVLIAVLTGVALGVIWFMLRIATLAGTTRGATLRDVNAVTGSIAFLGICVMLLAFANRYDREWDLTNEGRAEFAPQTIQILESLNADVEAYAFFVNTGDPLTDVTREKARRFLERCYQYTDRFSISIVDPQREPALVEAMNVNRVSKTGTIVLQCGARQRELPISAVTGRIDERAFTNALLKVARESTAKVYFLSGHGERDIDSADPKTGARQFRLWLEHESYAVAPLLLDPETPHVPTDCDALILMGYESDLSIAEIDAVNAYMNDGGRMLIMVDPQIVVSPSGISAERLRPWLRNRFGIDLHADVVVSRSSESFKSVLMHDFSALGEIANTVDPTDPFRGSYNMEHPITAMIDKQMVLTLSRTVRLNEDRPEGVESVVLLRSAPDAWAEEDLTAIVRRQPVQHDKGELAGTLPLAVAAAWAPEQDAPRTHLEGVSRIVVVGDAGLATNESMTVAAHQDFLLNTVAWLTEQSQLISIRQKPSIQQPVILSSTDERRIAWAAVLGAPQAILVLGVLTYLWRRRYR